MKEALMSEEARGLDAQLNPELVLEAMAMIEPAQRILLIAHEHPDGDCIGSALGLARILHLVGKTCVPACADPAPGNLSFLPGIAGLRHTLEDENFDLVIALDAGEFYRFGGLYEAHRDFFDHARVLNLDHHVSSEGCGQVNIIDPTSAATAELLVLFQQQTHLPLDSDAALCLLTGLITDTSSFQFTNTTPRSFEVAAVLLRAGAIPETVVQPIYRTRPLAQVRFQSMILASAQTACEGRLIWAMATDATLAAAGATPDMDENTSGMMRDIEGVQVAAFFKNYGDPTTTHLSLRCAKPYNAAEICQRLSQGRGQGGGHPRAAGATLYLPIEQAVEFVIGELKKEMESPILTDLAQN